jgi:CRISPR-associated protein Csm3
LTGLHIGGSDEGISIGGVDKTVIRNPLDNRPYIPGSSLRGKMRSLVEKYTGAIQNNSIGRDVKIHSCGANAKTEAEIEQATAEYKVCPVCQVFGAPGERKFSTPTRLIVRDVHLSEESAQELDGLRTDLPFTEVKTEVAIDRVTSAASPRQMERVPAGAIFGRAELVYSIYGGHGFDPAADLERFKTVVTGLQLLEDDYLGGLGSRGSGRVALQRIEVRVKARPNYDQVHEVGRYDQLPGLAADFEQLHGRITGVLPAA